MSKLASEAGSAVSDPEASNPVGESSKTTSDKRRHFRWKLGLAIFILGAIVEVAVWQYLAPDRTYQVIVSMGILSATAFLMVLWWIFASGLRWSTRFKGLGILVACVIATAASVRIDGVKGDMVPIFSFRWNPSAQEKALAYFDRNQPTSTPTEDSNLSADSSQSGLEISAGDWPEYRGPGRDGIVEGVQLERDWNTHPPELLWKHPVGLGWSSFAVVGNLAFTQEQRGEQEVVACYNVSDGQQVWLHEDAVRFEEAMGGPGPRATPTVHDSRLYALGATGILNCLDARTGRKLWSTNILEDAGVDNLVWAMSGSPLVYDRFVIVNPGGANGKSVAAYDRETGEPIWTAGNHPASYSAPRLTTVNGVTELLVFDADGLTGIDPQVGRELWHFPWTNGPKVNATQPILLSDEALFIASGYGMGSALLTIDSSGDQWTVSKEPRWESRQMKLKFNDAVLRDGFIYGLDEGILTCLEAATGERRWKRGRYGYGQMLLVDDLLLIQAESGDVVLVEAQPNEYQEVASFSALSGKTWNHPVLVGEHLLVRNGEEAACYRLQVIQNTPVAVAE